ncbi:MAG: hypothetical protein BWY87_01127 [Deltaproteobacteria bacterium ADurb.Bin510]|nr:MAG: hypothetical protein BWY87_01127 [Deltaproteobacteria bacterium ADurb.Bin510]
MPATASRRLTPAETELSLMILTRPISPVAAQWVPPQSSTETPPIETTRTVSPYFSPKSAMAPMLTARSLSIWSTLIGKSASTYWLTTASMRLICSALRASKWVKSKRARSSVTSEPLWCTCSPSTCCKPFWSRWVAL